MIRYLLLSLRVKRTLTLTCFPPLDYVGAILGLVRDQSDWRLDPLQTIRQLNHEFAPVGEGNVVSVEFNMLYRWHATLSQSNEKWFKEEVFEEVFPGKAADDVCIRASTRVAFADACFFSERSLPRTS